MTLENIVENFYDSISKIQNYLQICLNDLECKLKSDYNQKFDMINKTLKLILPKTRPLSNDFNNIFDEYGY